MAGYLFKYSDGLLLATHWQVGVWLSNTEDIRLLYWTVAMIIGFTLWTYHWIHLLKRKRPISCVTSSKYMLAETEPTHFLSFFLWFFLNKQKKTDWVGVFQCSFTILAFKLHAAWKGFRKYVLWNYSVLNWAWIKLFIQFFELHQWSRFLIFVMAPIAALPPLC